MTNIAISNAKKQTILLTKYQNEPTLFDQNSFWDWRFDSKMLVLKMP